MDTATLPQPVGPATPQRVTYPRRRRRSALPTTALLVAVGLAAAACGSSSGSAGTTTAPSTTAPSTTSAPPSSSAGSGSPSSAVVATTSVTGVGTVLVTASGRTLYRYTPDHPGVSTCYGECATAWPPLTVPAGTSTVTAGPGIPAGSLAVATRTGGALQVTYHGEPLYTYVGDKAPGQATGQGLGGVWYAVTTSGSGATDGATTTTAVAAGGY